MEINQNTCRPKLRSAIVSERGFLLIGSHVCCVLDLRLVICLSGQLVLAVSRFVRIAKTVREYNMASGVTLPPLHIYTARSECSRIGIVSMVHGTFSRLFVHF